MTQDDFVEKHRHELAGLMLDAMLEHRTGSAGALWLRVMMKKLDTRLVAIYQDMHPAKPQGEAKTLPMKGTR